MGETNGTNFWEKIQGNFFNYSDNQKTLTGKQLLESSYSFRQSIKRETICFVTSNTL